MPVFRYALERWLASPYEAVVFHRGALSAEQAALVRRLSGEAESERRPVNLTVRAVDLDAQPAPEMVELWKRQGLRETPALVLRYPASFLQDRDFWSGPLSESVVGRILDSPARRRIVQRLLSGDSAVWVLLESGDKRADDAAAAVLLTRLDHLQKTMKLPELAAEDIAQGVISVPEEELKVAFSLTRLSRADPAEAMLVQMLLGSEEDLRDYKEPMIFPVFGRGRLLYALVGKGIHDENVDEACSFLLGPCTCVVKEENPGVDLLIAADWDRLVGPLARTDRESTELTGLTAFQPDAKHLPSTQTRASTNLKPAVVGTSLPPQPAADGGAGGVLDGVWKVVALAGLAVLALVGAGALWLRRKG